MAESASRLATAADERMLANYGMPVASATTDFRTLPVRPSSTVAWSLGGRYLYKYLLPADVEVFSGPRPVDPAYLSRAHFMTPTPYTPGDAAAWLALRVPERRRRHVLIIDPALVPLILGPRWILMGMGLEYWLPNGFPEAAVVNVGVAPGTGWPVVIS